MAIDTKQKRSSAIMPLLTITWLLPEADSSVDQADRQTVCRTYSGIAAGGLTVPDVFHSMSRIEFGAQAYGLHQIETEHST